MAGRSLRAAPGSSGADSATVSKVGAMTLARWNRLSEWPLTVAAVVFLIAYAVTVLGHLRPPVDVIPEAVMTATWIAFAIDYVVSLALAKPRGRWFLRHLPDLVVVALPVLRPLRLLRLVRLAGHVHRAAGPAFRGRVTAYIAFSATLLVLIAGLGVLDAEQDAPGANILTFGDAIWWAFVTITTVGYGDYYPVTVLGRLVAAGLMLSGIALLGSVTATLASWFVERIRDAKDSQADELTIRPELLRE